MLGVLHGVEELEAQLAGVAGTREQRPRHVGDGGFGKRVVGEGRGREIGIGQRAQEPSRVRSLDRQVGVLVAEIRHRDAEVAPGGAQRAQHGGDPGWRGEQPIAFRCQPEAGQVIDHSAFIVAERGVDGAPNGEAGGVRNHDVLNKGRGVAAGNLDRNLIVDVEHADGFARCAMFLFGRREHERRGGAVW